jgi:hypothetical protein
VGNTIEVRMDWVLERIADRGAGLTDEQLHEHLMPREGRELDGMKAAFATWADRVGAPMTVVERHLPQSGDDDSTGSVVLQCERERRWELSCRLDAAEPRRIAWYNLERSLPEGVEIRVAGPADSAALAELYRSVPMVAGDLEVTIDIGDDYFLSTRLMPESHTLIATDHGRPVGLYTGTRFPSMLNGRRCKVILGCHTRIDAGKAGGGVWSRMNRQLIDHFANDYDAAMAFVLTGNAAASRLTTAGAWPAGPVRAVIPCTAFSADDRRASSARSATPEDASRIAEVLNETHMGRELFLPYTAASISERLERAPDLYGWTDVWIAADDDEAVAVVGVGTHFHHRVTKSPADERRSTRAIVYDYGFRGGHRGEALFLALLGARARALAAEGASHLSAFTSERAPLYPVLAGLAESLEQYDLLVPPVPPDDDADGRGVYVDPTVF